MKRIDLTLSKKISLTMPCQVKLIMTPLILKWILTRVRFDSLKKDSSMHVEPSQTNKDSINPKVDFSHEV